MIDEFEVQLEHCEGRHTSAQMIDVTLKLQDSTRNLIRLPRTYAGIVEQIMAILDSDKMEQSGLLKVGTCLDGFRHICVRQISMSSEEDSSLLNYISGIEHSAFKQDRIV